MKLWILQSWVWPYKAPLDALQRFKLCTTCPHWHGSHQACSEPWHPGWPFPAAPRLKTCMCLVHRYLHLSSLLQQPRPRNKPRWVKKHFLKMKSLKAPLCMLIFSPVISYHNSGTMAALIQVERNSLRKCRPIRKYFGSQRVQHVQSLACYYIMILLWHHDQWPKYFKWPAEAGDILATSNFEGTSNLSQQINRMGNNVHHAPCVTPKAALYNFHENRPFCGIDKLVFQCFPVVDMKLNHLSEEAASQHWGM